MISPGYVEGTKMLHCRCGGRPEYRGIGVVDQYQCDRCGWATAPYWDGADFAQTEWNKRQMKVEREE